MNERTTRTPGTEFQAMLDSIGVGHWEYDHRGDKLRFGPCLRAAVGGDFPLEMGSPLADWLGRIHPDDQARVAAAVEGSIQEGAPFDVEYRFAHATGRWVWLMSRGRVTARDDEGHPLRSSGVKTDITARKESEEQARLLQHFHRILSENPDREHLVAAILDTATLLSDIDAGGFYWHEAGGEFALAAHRGLSPAFVASVARVAQDDPRHAIAVAGKMVVSCTRQCTQCMSPDLVRQPGMRAEGLTALAVFPITVFGRVEACLHLASRHVTCLLGSKVGFLQDLATEFGQALELLGAREAVAQQRTRLERSESVLRATLDATADGILVVGADGRIISANRRFQQLWHVPDTVLDSGEDAELLRFLQDQLADPQGFLAEVRRLYASDAALFDTLHFKDGRVYERYTVPLCAGEQRGRVWSFRDVTVRVTAMKELEKERALLATLIRAIPDLVWLKDPQGVYLACNPMFERFIGAPHTEIVGRTDFDFVAPDLADARRQHDGRAVEAGGPTRHEEWITFADSGTRALLETTKTPVFSAAKEVIGVLGIGHDITDRKATEEALREAEGRLRIFIERFPGGVLVENVDRRILLANQGFCDLFQIPVGPAFLVGADCAESARQTRGLFADPDGFLSRVEAVLAEQRPALAEEVGMADGRTLQRDYVPAMAKDRLVGHVWFYRDITDRKRTERQLEHIAHFDALTGLPNRVLLADRLHQAMIHAQRRRSMVAVVYIDLDGFKAVNDHHGHEVGDQLLAAVATRMKESLRQGDTLARLGGDEFVAVMADLAETEASVPMLIRLLAAAAQPVHVDGAVLQVSASLGVTFFPQAEPIEAEQLLRQADQAMYQAKLAGKNRYHVFDIEHDRSLKGHHETLERVREALGHGEFVLHYQPKVNMRTGALVGAEALIRWAHPEAGLLPPGRFLAATEDHPLGIELGEWVLESALCQLEAWRGRGLDIPVSVNLGARQIQQADFVEKLARLLAEHPSVRPGSLELEVVETSALEDMAHVSEVMRACGRMGVSFALDDFGTGYSSLTYLKRLPAALLKIDQSFVADMLDDPDDLAILEGVLGLATAFRRQVIAEGVETLEHGVLLLQLGCELAQGYAIARPMPADEMAAWARTWQPDPAWRGYRRVPRDKLPLLFAAVEHRAWVKAIEQCIGKGRTVTPPMDAHACNVGLWLDGDGQALIPQPALRADIERLHQLVHDTAVRLLDLHAKGQTAAAAEGLVELSRLRDALLAALNDAIDGTQRTQGADTRLDPEVGVV